jgi:hypothetical protein
MDHRRGRFDLALFVGALAALAACSLLAAQPSRAASIPVWLDDAITDWNDAHPGIQIRFVDIKDSYVWYVIPDTPEIGHKDIRASIYEITTENKYQRTAEEELVTTGKPPSFTDAHKEKKCWTRSYVLNIEELSNTRAVDNRGERAGQRQRMLTTLVCEDGDYWFAGFRILQ